MRHYKDNNNNFFGFEDNIEVDSSIYTEISIDHIQEFNKNKEDEYKKSVEYKIDEAKKYLSDTDYKMTIDYFATLTKEVQDELIRLRANAREFVRNNE